MFICVNIWMSRNFINRNEGYYEIYRNDLLLFRQSAAVCYILQNTCGPVILPFVLSGCETHLNPRVDSISKHSFKESNQTFKT